MPRFFIENPLKVGCDVVIDGENAQHIGKSLRMKCGEQITLCNQDGYDYDCTIASVEKKNVVCNVLSQRINESEPKIKVTIYQALPKNDKMELIIQKAVELGVSNIIPFSSCYCISKIENAADIAKKQVRWQKIADEAAKQCGRGKIPHVGAATKIDEICEDLSKYDAAFVAYEIDGEKSIALKEYLQMHCESIKGKDNASIAIIVGAEGGFSQEEIERLHNASAAIVTLGKRILRCETAAIILCALVLYEFEG